MSEYVERVSDEEVGKRLRVAREAAKMSQADAATIINAARTTIVAIEKGQRRVRIDELQKLTRAFSTTANAILRNEAAHLDLVPHFRKLPEAKTDDVEIASKYLNSLVNAEVELENSLGVRRSRNYPPERPILRGDIAMQAEQDAQELRNWLGMGPGPILDIVTFLELSLGVRVYVRKLSPRISGLYAYDEIAGACMLLNANHSLERSIQTGVHEVGHFLSSRKQPQVVTDDPASKSDEEIYAEVFGRCFLTPARSVKQAFSDLTAGHSHITRRHIILLANTFGVSREALTRRLEELRLVPRGTWDWFKANNGITLEQVRQVLGDVPNKLADSASAQGPVPPRLALLARESYKRDIYSEGQLAQLLQVDLHTVRDILVGAEFEGIEANDQVKIPQ